MINLTNLSLQIIHKYHFQKQYNCIHHNHIKTHQSITIIFIISWRLCLSRQRGGLRRMQWRRCDTEVRGTTVVALKSNDAVVRSMTIDSGHKAWQHLGKKASYSGGGASAVAAAQWSLWPAALGLDLGGFAFLVMFQRIVTVISSLKKKYNTRAISFWNSNCVAIAEPIAKDN